MNAPARVRDARPAFLIDDQENVELGRRLLALAIIEEQGGLYRCEASFANWGDKNGSTGFLYFDRSTLEFGKTFAVRYEDRALFEGRVMALEAHFPEGNAPSISVLCEDRLQDLRMTRRTRDFVDISDADLIARIAQDHGLTPNVDVDGSTHRVLAQVNQSDLALVRDRARAIDADIWVEGRSLHAKARSRRTSTPVELVYNSGLRSFRARADLAHQRTSVKATGWDPAQKRGIAPEATEAAVRAELGQDEGGASIVRAKLGERRELIAHGCPGSEAEARARAEAYFRQGARRFVTGDGVAAPNTELRAGRELELSGLGPLFDGKYHAAATCWLFDESGMRVEFRAERAGLGRP